jgi:hypothetical protein
MVARPDHLICQLCRLLLDVPLLIRKALVVCSLGGVEDTLLIRAVLLIMSSSTTSVTLKIA